MGQKMLYLSRVRLNNVRCFNELDLKLSGNDNPAGWTVFVGDNATGKSTLLRSIAMGLCDEASAAGLLKESDEGYIRRGQSQAQIDIELRDRLKPNTTFRITTSVIRKQGVRGIFSDIVRQKTSPPRESFPWDEIFVAGYGSGRGVAGTGDISTYSSIDAVYNMFNYNEGLQNPELTIRRITEGSQKKDREIFQILQRVTRTSSIRLTRRGILVDGPWGKGMPLRDLSDGYRSVFIWLTDLIGWALTFKPTLRGPKGIRGIVLIDEVEQHLHARWQRTVVNDLREMMPNVQYVTTTHSPLVASSVGHYMSDQQSDRLFVLEATEQNAITAAPHAFMKGWRMDQVLASRAFKYQIETDPDYEKAFRVASALLSKGSRTAEEETFLQAFKDRIRDSMGEETSPIEQLAEKELIESNRHKIEELERKLFPGEQE